MSRSSRRRAVASADAAALFCSCRPTIWWRISAMPDSSARAMIARSIAAPPDGERESQDEDHPDHLVGPDPRCCGVAEAEEVIEVLVVRRMRQRPVPEAVGDAAESGCPPGHGDHEREDRERQVDDAGQHIQPRLRILERGQRACGTSRSPGRDLRYAGRGDGRPSTPPMPIRCMSASPRAISMVSASTGETDQGDQQPDAQRQAGDDQGERHHGQHEAEDRVDRVDAELADESALDWRVAEGGFCGMVIAVMRSKLRRTRVRAPAGPPASLTVGLTPPVTSVDSPGRKSA